MVRLIMVQILFDGVIYTCRCDFCIYVTLHLSEYHKIARIATTWRKNPHRHYVQLRQRRVNSIPCYAVYVSDRVSRSCSRKIRLQRSSQHGWFWKQFRGKMLPSSLYTGLAESFFSFVTFFILIWRNFRSVHMAQTISDSGWVHSNAEYYITSLSTVRLRRDLIFDY